MDTSKTPFTQLQNFDVGTLYAGTYLKADDLAGKTYVATIAAVERVEIPEESGAVRPRAAVQLQGWPAKLLLNKTNFESIAKAYGRQSAGWIGKPLEVYPDSVLFGGRMVACIRVRVTRPAVPAAAPPGDGRPDAPSATTAAPPASAAPGETSATVAPLMPASDFVDDLPY